MHNSNKFQALILVSLVSLSSFAVPIDWRGSLEVDSTIIKDVRRTGDSCDSTKGECIGDEENNARFQNMILQLNPNIIVNDGVTIKGEISTGSATGNTSTSRSTNLGSSTTVDTDTGTNTNAGSYYTQQTSSALNLNQIYAEIYADTALYRVGRFAKHFGLGAVVNAGTKPGDRFYSGYEGFEAQLEIQNFHLDLMWAKLHTGGNPNGSRDAFESSVTALYDNPKRNMKFGVYYALREVETDNTLYGTGTGPQNVTLIDVFFSKAWDDFSFGLEIPMLSGEVGNVYGTGEADFDANAYILETKYQVNSKWNIGINAGMVKGDNGDTDSFEGIYLNPNYQLAEVLFRYNYYGFNDATNYNIFDSSIVNATYAQFFAHYKKGEWGWKLSALWAKANETAEEGKKYFNHAKRALSNAVATEDQSDDLGYEFDVAFEYQWNPSVMFSGFVGYHVVGDYYTFSDDTEEISTTNVMSTGMRLAVQF